MAAEFPDCKEQLVFLINNYDMMLAVLTVREIREEIEILNFIGKSHRSSIVYKGQHIANNLILAILFE